MLLLNQTRVIWRLGLLGRGAYIFAGVVVATVAGAYLASLFSLRQPGAVALDVGLSIYKIAALFLVALWVQEFISRDLDRKTILAPLASPLSRSQYLLSRFVGIWSMLCLLTAASVVGVTAVAYHWETLYPHAEPLGDAMHVAATAVLLLLDQTVILAFMVGVASVATVSSLPVLAGLAFAVICRSIGPAVTFLTEGDAQHKWVSSDIHHVVGTVKWFLPDLSRFDLRGMALYSEPVAPQVIGLLAGLAAAYSALFLLAGMYSFSRRDIV